MKKIILLLCLVFSINIFAELQRLAGPNSRDETLRTQGKTFEYDTQTAFDVYSTLEQKGFSPGKKNIYYYSVSENNIPKIKQANGKFNYSTSPNDRLGSVYRDGKDLTFTPSGQKVEKGDWYTLEYNKVLKIYIADDTPGSGKMITFKPKKSGLGISAQSSEDAAIEKSKLVQIVENNKAIPLPVEKKPTFFDRAKKIIKGNQ